MLRSRLHLGRCAPWIHPTSSARRRAFFSTTRHWQDKCFPTAPKALINIKSIRQNPAIHARNCIDRNYPSLASCPQQIVVAHQKWLEHDKVAQDTRKALRGFEFRIRDANEDEKEPLLKQARTYRDSLDAGEKIQRSLQEEVESLSAALPNLMSSETPIGEEPRILEIVEPSHKRGDSLQDHVRIGNHLHILDFTSAASISGTGFYFLLNDGERLEHALVQHARSMAQKCGFLPCSPPSLIYSDIGTACGFRPRDHHGEQQVYAIQQSALDIDSRKPNRSLAGTAEIPFAGLHANSTLDHGALPQRLVGSSRCYRAEAGAHGRQGRGLYRVHEFTKVEMFAWTMPGEEMSIFKEMVSIQRDIIRSLELPYRILEMPSWDLGASAYRKQDIEVYFPSRTNFDNGWGEVTSTSICTDYQTRRLNTRLRMPPGSQPGPIFPSTVNGTAMAVPRVLAAILENGWRKGDEVRIPEVLWPYMGGQQVISKAQP